ncbi:MAG: hypothetical protein EOO02_08660 [Chitinophagaceae bacterium]|nr:MAG: hypothetical protein EOO02_08660 [Chitinophagaceae bacterium]
MNRPTIFYFVHAHGNGHRATFNMLYPALSQFFKVIAITTNKNVSGHLLKKYDVEIFELPSKYPVDYVIPDHTFSKPFEVTPYAVEPAVRAKALAEAIERYSPKALYCDGVPELAIMCRGMGVPIVLVRLPGNLMKDPTQVFAYQLADQIIAHFPSCLEQANYGFAYKTFYSGYMSKYSGQELKPLTSSATNNITVLSGYDNYDHSVLKNITKDQNTRFTIIGNKQDYDLDKNCTQLGPVPDIREAIAGELVISAAGQNSVAELLSLGKRLILLPEPRPYDEQAVHAELLADLNVVLLASHSMSAVQWQELLEKARQFNPSYKDLVNPMAEKVIAEKMKNRYA